MSGYNRSCSRANSSILLAAQCAAALSMMPASAPSCWAQGVTAASYKEYAIWVSPSGGIFKGETIGEARTSCQQVLSLPNTPFTTFARYYVRFRGIAEADRRALLVDRDVNDPTRTSPSPNNTCWKPAARLLECYSACSWAWGWINDAARLRRGR